jgi:predicted phosphodiesterase
MKYAIISDLHANLEALTASLEKIDAEGADRIICLGDLVGYYANPNECVRIICTRNIKCIAGNHDRAAIGIEEPVQFVETARRAILWTKEKLTEDSVRFLGGLPLSEVIDGRFLIVHAALHPEPNPHLRLTTMSEIAKSFDALIRSGMRICFFGHTHQSVVYEQRNCMLSSISRDTVELDPNAYYMINPGSVGQSRDRDPRASFLIFDADRQIVRFYRVAYDRASCYRKAEEAGLLHKESLLRRSADWVNYWLEAGKARLVRADGDCGSLEERR